MKRHAIFVDAGYLFAQGAVSLDSVSVLGRSAKRTDLKLDEAEVLKQLKAIAKARSAGAEILRIYWYDGARNGPTVEHLAIANMEDVKLRLGSINNSGEQKEVDSLLITDLIDLARNQSICDATLVASDSDIRIAVLIAQSFGVRVHLVGLEPSRVSQSPLLRQEADTVHEIERAMVSQFLTLLVPVAPVATTGQPPRSAVPTSLPPIQGAAKTIRDIMGDSIKSCLATASKEDIERLKLALASTSGIPQEYDGRLLGISRSMIGRDLTGDERREMRTAFRSHVLTI